VNPLAFQRARISVLAAVALGMVFAAGAFAAAPPIDQVSFAPQVGASLPLDARFVDEHGRMVQLGDYFRDRPVILVLGYYGCSNLCSVVLQGLVQSLSNADLHPGRDLDIVVASIAPFETPDLALQKKRSVLAGAANADQEGWHFLTGKESSIEPLAASLGYRYAYDDVQHQYAHAAGIVAATPDGRVARTLYGVAFASNALRDALHRSALPIAASHATGDKWLLCFHYDPQTGRYSLVAMSAVRMTALGVLVGLGAFFVRARRTS